MRIKRFNESLTVREYTNISNGLNDAITYGDKLDKDTMNNYFDSITYLKYHIIKLMKMLGSNIIPTSQVDKNVISEFMELIMKYKSRLTVDISIDQELFDIMNYLKSVKRSIYIYTELQDLIESPDYKVNLSNQTTQYLDDGKITYTFDINIFPKSDGWYNFTFKNLEELITDINAIKHRFSEITITHMLLTDMRIKFKTLVVDIP